MTMYLLFQEPGHDVEITTIKGADYQECAEQANEIVEFQEYGEEGPLTLLLDYDQIKRLGAMIATL